MLTAMFRQPEPLLAKLFIPVGGSRLQKDKKRSAAIRPAPQADQGVHYDRQPAGALRLRGTSSGCSMVGAMRSLSGSGPIQPHAERIDLRHSFALVYKWLRDKGPCSLKTSRGTPFEARGSIADDGRAVMRFFQHGHEYGRAYSCCWGHYYNCNRTRIGMYCEALDGSLPSAI
jgi:hypothetical protein